TTGVGVAVADSLMWERNPIPGALSGIYGLLQPLIFAGIPAQACILERATEPGYLDRFRTIVVSYEVLKPPAPETNEALAKWCREGGALLVVGEPGVLDGPFWWNKMGFASPIDHLLKLLDCTDAVRDDT